MGVPDVLAARARTDLEGIEHHRAICRAHITSALADILVPFTVGSVTVSRLSEQQMSGGAWCLRVDGSGGGISWPVFIESPALMVDDPAGEWVDWNIDRGNGQIDREMLQFPTRKVNAPEWVTGWHRYRYDPAEALRILLVRLSGQG